MANKIHWLVAGVVGSLMLSSCGGGGAAPGTGGGSVQPPMNPGYIPAVGASVGTGANIHPLAKVMVVPSAEEVQLLNLINEVRTSGTIAGQRVPADSCVPGALASGPLTKLSYSGVLANAARRHAEYMGQAGYMAHEEEGEGTERQAGSPYFYGTLVANRVNRSLDEAALPNSYDFLASNSGENVAGGTPGETTTGYATPQEVMLAWVNSDQHCVNLMNREWVYMGTGYFKNSDPQTKQFPRLHMNNWVQVFSIGMPKVSYTFR